MKNSYQYGRGEGSIELLLDVAHKRLHIDLSAVGGRNPSKQFIDFLLGDGPQEVLELIPREVSVAVEVDVPKSFLEENPREKLPPVHEDVEKLAEANGPRAVLVDLGEDVAGLLGSELRQLAEEEGGELGGGDEAAAGGVDEVKGARVLSPLLLRQLREDQQRLQRRQQVPPAGVPSQPQGHRPPLHRAHRPLHPEEGVLERVGHLQPRDVIWLEQLEQDVLIVEGELLPVGAEGVRDEPVHFLPGLEEVPAAEGVDAGDHLVHDHPAGPGVALDRVHPLEDLRRHVAHRPDLRPVLEDRPRALHRQAEVDDPQVHLRGDGPRVQRPREGQVLGLEVAVQDAQRVQVGDPAEELGEDLARELGGGPREAAQEVGQRAAGAELGDDVHEAAEVEDLEDAEHVGVAGPAEDTELLQELLLHARVREDVAPQHLYCALGARAHPHAAEDLPEGARPQPLLEDVLLPDVRLTHADEVLLRRGLRALAGQEASEERENGREGVGLLLLRGGGAGGERRKAVLLPLARRLLRILPGHAQLQLLDAADRREGYRRQPAPLPLVLPQVLAPVLKFSIANSPRRAFCGRDCPQRTVVEEELGGARTGQPGGTRKSGPWAVAAGGLRKLGGIWLKSENLDGVIFRGGGGGWRAGGGRDWSCEVVAHAERVLCCESNYNLLKASPKGKEKWKLRPSSPLAHPAPLSIAPGLTPSCNILSPLPSEDQIVKLPFLPNFNSELPKFLHLSACLSSRIAVDCVK